MLTLYMWLLSWLKRDEGQDLIEYAVLIVFIAIFVIAILRLLGPAITAVYQYIITALGETP